MQFCTIEELVKYQPYCKICNKKLKTLLVSRTKSITEKKFLKSKYSKQKFIFTYDKVNGEINGTTNEIVLSKNVSSLFNSATVPIERFYTWEPYIERYCSSRKCGMKYHLGTYKLDVSNFFNHIGTITFNWIYYESITIEDEFYVLNDFRDKSAYIYSLNYNVDPIVYELLDFSVGKELLSNRIKNIVMLN